MENDQVSPPPKRLTLKLSGLGSSVSASTSTPTPGGNLLSAMSPPPATPGGGMKIKLVRKSLPPTPADGAPPSSSVLPPLHPASAPPLPQPMPKTQSGRQPKPTAKKRSQEESDDDVPLANGKGPEPKAKRAKITLKASTSSAGIQKLPTVKVKTAGRIPPRPLGEGYDSEAEDREVDPVIEEQVLFRMLPGEHCEYIRKAIIEKKIGIPKALGGADISIKFLDNEGRRAMVVVQGQPFAAIMLDLPTITEGMKTWDKKAMVKSADICQMLLVFAQVSNEEEAKTAPLPKAVEHGHRWPHGITPPMHDARNRRFRKRLSKLEIQNKEAEVERLLAADREALSTRYEFVDDTKSETLNEESGEEYEEEQEDAEGEVDDYFGDAEVGQEDEALFDEDLLEAEFMNAFENDDQMDLATPAVGMDATTPATANMGTPAGQTEASGQDGADEESGEEDDDDEGEDDREDVDDGGDEERHDEVAGVKAEIAALKKQLAQYDEQLRQSSSIMIRKRIESSIKNIKSEIKLKQSAIGEMDED
ncbi:transcription initiation factor TFIID subunit 7 [Echria macrotheca]|uniref:Transcription initiation factor TFIID subunit 7 n=1 Tax=Echria macrotheca TaxID=438768 RepID=A0AAJ0BIF6_9PEZI|nr:transcription initiation factor TFIID subunit 7 [Echria macrotheca]